jgi:hypothetical protein
VPPSYIASGLGMILDILTVLFFVLGFALILWMVWERRGDVLHRVNVERRRRTLACRPRHRKGQKSSEEPKAKGK